MIAAVLAFAYFSADDVKLPVDSSSPSSETSSVTQISSDAEQTSADTTTVKTDTTTSQNGSDAVSSMSVTTAVTSAVPTETTTSNTTVTTTLKPAPPTTTVSEAVPQARTCSFMISCATVFDNKDKLRAGVIDIMPSDGIIFPRTNVTIQDGDTVYDILKRICKENKIHIESTKIAATNSYYIEGIANLYEFDAGNLSGWMYSVDGKFPQISTSMYKLHGGEKVEIVYSCNIGVDVGDDYFKKAG